MKFLKVFTSDFLLYYCSILLNNLERFPKWSGGIKSIVDFQSEHFGGLVNLIETLEIETDLKSVGSNRNNNDNHGYTLLPVAKIDERGHKKGFHSMVTITHAF